MTHVYSDFRGAEPRQDHTPYAAAPYRPSVLYRAKRDNAITPLIWGCLLVFVPLYWAVILAYFVQIVF
ncbi:MAG: hypothetical protein N4A61_09600 [Pelagimonas sp.]|jgi:hypothetical protein|nr:hypothetical protein [Pelagimonas sp.]